MNSHKMNTENNDSFMTETPQKESIPDNIRWESYFQEHNAWKSLFDNEKDDSSNTSK